MSIYVMMAGCACLIELLGFAGLGFMAHWRQNAIAARAPSETPDESERACTGLPREGVLLQMGRQA
jgi:hypothetical protein